MLIRVCFVKCDVTSKYDWSEMWTQAETVLGGKIEILCNNAGVPPSVRSTCLNIGVFLLNKVLLLGWD